MKARLSKGNKDSALLINVAESIGSTLGTLAAKANAAQKALTRSRAAHSVKRQVRKLMRKRKSVAHKTGGSASIKPRKSKRARATRGSLRGATPSLEWAARHGTGKAHTARRKN
jgi:hypothetical protein